MYKIEPDIDLSALNDNQKSILLIYRRLSEQLSANKVATLTAELPGNSVSANTVRTYRDTGKSPESCFDFLTAHLKPDTRVKLNLHILMISLIHNTEVNAWTKAFARLPFVSEVLVLGGETDLMIKVTVPTSQDVRILTDFILEHQDVKSVTTSPVHRVSPTEFHELDGFLEEEPMENWMQNFFE